MTKPRRRQSPRCCPKCGSCDVTSEGTVHSCNRCEFRRATPFPTVGSSTFVGKNTTSIDGSSRGMPTGCTRVMPAGNKYS